MIKGCDRGEQLNTDGAPYLVFPDGLGNLKRGIWIQSEAERGFKTFNKIKRKRIIAYKLIFKSLRRC